MILKWVSEIGVSRLARTSATDMWPTSRTPMHAVRNACTMATSRALDWNGSACHPFCSGPLFRLKKGTSLNTAQPTKNCAMKNAMLCPMASTAEGGTCASARSTNGCRRAVAAAGSGRGHSPQNASTAATTWAAMLPPRPRGPFGHRWPTSSPLPPAPAPRLPHPAANLRLWVFGRNSRRGSATFLWWWLGV